MKEGPQCHAHYPPKKRRIFCGRGTGRWAASSAGTGPVILLYARVYLKRLGDNGGRDTRATDRFSLLGCPVSESARADPSSARVCVSLLSLYWLREGDKSHRACSRSGENWSIGERGRCRR